jgi:hypothetical protein
MAAYLTSKTLQQALRNVPPCPSIVLRVFPTRPADMLIKVDVIYRGADISGSTRGSLVALTFDRIEPLEDVVEVVEAAARALAEAKAIRQLKAQAPRRHFKEG